MPGDETPPEVVQRPAQLGWVEDLGIDLESGNEADQGLQVVSADLQDRPTAGSFLDPADRWRKDPAGGVDVELQEDAGAELEGKQSRRLGTRSAGSGASLRS